MPHILAFVSLLNLSDFFDSDAWVLDTVYFGDMHETSIGLFWGVFGDETNGRIFEEDYEDDRDNEYGQAEEDKHNYLIVRNHQEP